MDRRKTLIPYLFVVPLAILLFSCSSSNAQSTSCNSYRFSNNNVFANCSALPALGSFLHWNFDEATGTVSIAFRRPGTSSSSWISWGLNPNGRRMVGTQAIVAFTNSSGQFEGYTSQVSSYKTRLQRGGLSFGVSRVSASLVGDEAIIFATLELPADMIQTNQVWQVGPVSGGIPQVHPTNGENGRSLGRINFRSGQAAAGGGGGGGLSDRDKKRNIHGVLNAVSWGILMPIGAIMARYVKVFANPAWFYIHVACQFSAYVVGVAGWATGIKLGNDSPGTSYAAHRNIGIILFAFGTLQAFAVLLRPKPDNKYRMYWNVYHHSIGYSTIVLSIVNVFEGLDILDPEDKWTRAYVGILIFLGACVVILEPLTWFIVLRRRRRSSSHRPGADKHHSNGHVTNGGSHMGV
ncbi:PREDICTED: cytochrome b561 and DOMON domain-containing protein At5g35735-like [Tarenaya hassleriana]|uniref:cytochrome b561 and DOMON domain-containing protein At5g35735-like n=1 Tax=Tarenaya hassleriana TaxID=28532 RepID=UPI00053C933E|nr:PREDICTED: cytochrome b561 and DOMON domain-containing protein At5g35735-like [Tarenaya hassleriana]